MIAGTGAAATTWFSWHQSFVIAGQHDDADEKNGTLDFLDPTLKDTLLSLSFTGLGISSISADRSASATDTIPRVRATMYVERNLLGAPTNLALRPYDDGAARLTTLGPARLREAGIVDRLRRRDLGDVAAGSYRDFVRPPRRHPQRGPRA